MQLRCPYIIEALTYTAIGLNPIFIQEYLDIDLHDYMVEYGRLSFDNVICLFYQMAKALYVLEVSLKYLV